MTWTLGEMDRIINAWNAHHQSGSRCRMYLEDCPSRYDLKALATTRDGFRQGTEHNRELSEDYEFIGLMGELAFHYLTGYALDTNGKPEGDRGIDFYTPAGTVDVKTATELYGLFVEANKQAYADVFVLARWDRTFKEAHLVGWAKLKDVLSHDPKKSKRGVWNHHLAVKGLRRMKTWDAFLAEALKNGDDFPERSLRVTAASQ